MEANHIFRFQAVSAPDSHPTAMVCDPIPRAEGTGRPGSSSLHILERRRARLVCDTPISSPNILDVGWGRSGIGPRLVSVPDSD